MSENDRFAEAQPDVQVDVRCSVVVMRRSSVLLLERVKEARHLVRDAIHPREEDTSDRDWVLPGGRPRHGEGMAACARRETEEETGLAVDTGRCLFVLEVADTGSTRLLELVFAAEPHDVLAQPTRTESGLRPEFVPLADLNDILRPPLAGHLRELRWGRDTGAPYLGNLWRPRPGRREQEE